MAELLVGRRGSGSAIGSVRNVAIEEKASPSWSIIGWGGMIAAFLVLSFYSVIAGWIILYIPQMASGAFVGVDGEGSGLIFGDLLGDSSKVVLGHSLFIVTTTFIVIRGLKKGIEWAVSFLMPLFFLLLILLSIYSAIVGDFSKAFIFLFDWDLSKVTPPVVLSALGHAFFSIGIGTSIMLTYGAYLDKESNIQQSAFIIALADTMIAIVAGLLIFPIVFGYGLDPAEGPGLIFVTLPIAFGQMPFGVIVGTCFFILALVAAVTSSISMLEIMVSWAEEHTNVNRQQGALVAGAAAWATGLITVFSFNKWSNIHPLSMFEEFETATMFDLLDNLTSRVMLPVNALLMAIFIGWVVSRKTSKNELRHTGSLAFSTWYLIAKYFVPFAVAGILLYRVGLLEWLF
jgi:NSS family neurotransmitter:Na+ symporter